MEARNPLPPISCIFHMTLKRSKGINDYDFLLASHFFQCNASFVFEISFKYWSSPVLTFFVWFSNDSNNVNFKQAYENPWNKSSNNGHKMKPAIFHNTLSTLKPTTRNDTQVFEKEWKILLPQVTSSRNQETKCWTHNSCSALEFSKVWISNIHGWMDLRWGITIKRPLHFTST